MSAISRPDSDSPTSIPRDSAAIRRLTDCRSEFLRFFRKRLSRPEDAEDAFQDFCVKVIRSAQSPEDDKIDAWLSRVLRNTLTDHYRRRAARQRATLAYEHEAPETVFELAADEGDRPCHCIGELVPTLRPEYAEIVRRADLEEEPRKRIAADLGLTANNVGVRLHRARQALKEKIEARCRTCRGSDFGRCDCGTGDVQGEQGRPE